MSDDIRLFLDPVNLRSLPEFDVLRLVSDALRWKKPSWKVAQIGGRDVCAMARSGWGLQGQVFSRHGLQRLAARLGPITAPVDHIYYHDCHVPGFRILEVRPGVIEHDETWIRPELLARSDIGVRPDPDPKAMRFADRVRRNVWRQRRKFWATRNFFHAWGFAGMARVLSHWPPGGYFR